MRVWPYPPVSACPTPQSPLPQAWVGGVFNVCWGFLVLRRWAVAVILGLSGMWREGQKKGGLTWDSEKTRWKNGGGRW